MLTTYTNYQLITKDLQKSLTRTASDPVVARDTQYYLENIGKVKSIDDFLKNTRLFNYAMKATGLEDMAYAKAFMRKVLTEGVEAKDAFANRLTDSRYKEFATIFNFARDGAATTASEKAQKGIVDKYVRQTLETSAGKDDQGVRLALYFSRKAAEIKNPYDILGDTALLQVVQTALGLPSNAASANIDKQADMIERHLKIETLKDPTEVDRFLKRFTAMWDAQNAVSSSPLLTLFSDASAGIDMEMIISLQNIRRGGI